MPIRFRVSRSRPRHQPRPRSRATARLLALIAGAAICGVIAAAAAPRQAAARGAAVAPRAADTLPPLPADSTLFIRVNQLGYLPGARKVAVACALAPRMLAAFEVRDTAGRVVLAGARALDGGPFGPCVDTWRLDFSAVRAPGHYVVEAGGARSPVIPIGDDVWDGAADTLLRYMREQRSGWNPVFRDSVHTKDGIIVDSPDSGRHVTVTGGWADASDYLQYVATSATATFDLLLAWRDHPRPFADVADADGRAGANGVPDVLDEARHGLEWLVRMFPGHGVMFNQIADDRDHAFWDLPTTDTSDYGWGRGGPRPVYPCTGRPQGLFGHLNRSDGYASTAGKYAAAFALGARIFAARDRAFADTLRRKAGEAYALGRAHPGVCQTAPGHSPYFYEEENWTDDMELGAAELFALTGDARFRGDGERWAAREPVTPWMGRDTARHYEWYPWWNAGHYELWRAAPPRARARLAEFYRRGLEAVARRARNGFGVGIPFIWCSNDLMASVATQALLYRRMTGDTTFLALESAARDWLFGANPWGVSMVIGLPAGGAFPRDPHSVVSDRLHLRLTGGLVDGPVYRSIYGNLLGIRLHEPDEYARFNPGFVVYHDDLGDYSTNEPIMDGTANLAYLLSALAAEGRGGANPALAR